MWYEILPSLGITAAFSIAPFFVGGLFNWLDTGRAHRRLYYTVNTLKLIARDYRMGGNMYNLQYDIFCFAVLLHADRSSFETLDNIPDEGESLDSLRHNGSDPVGDIRMAHTIGERAHFNTA